MVSTDAILDVAIVGGGFAGAALAATLSARGYRIAVCDPHEVHPKEFRAEKLATDQIEALDRLGLAGPALRAATPIGGLRIVRAGRVVDAIPSLEFGFDYRALVSALRAEVPAGCWIRRPIEAIEAIDGLQRVRPRDGEPLVARVVALATGHALSLRKTLGLERVLIRANHSLCIGFDIDVGPGDARACCLTYFGERVGDRVGYLTTFPIGERLRANLFVYREPGEAWSRAFRADPAAALRAALPGLARLLPPFTIPEPPVLRPIDLFGPPAEIRAGVALIGDAYSTTCPAGGGGLAKGLTDVETMLTHLPRWLGQSGGVGADDIADYYRDPVKRASEARARRAAETSRASAIDPGLLWEARRRRNYYGWRANAWLRRRFGWGIGGSAAATM